MDSTGTGKRLHMLIPEHAEFSPSTMPVAGVGGSGLHASSKAVSARLRFPEKPVVFVVQTDSKPHDVASVKYAKNPTANAHTLEVQARMPGFQRQESVRLARPPLQVFGDGGHRHSRCSLPSIFLTSLRGNRAVSSPASDVWPRFNGQMKFDAAQIILWDYGSTPSAWERALIRCLSFIARSSSARIRDRTILWKASRSQHLRHCAITSNTRLSRSG